MTQFFDLCDDRTPSIYTTQTLYKLDSLGKLRTWRMELDENGRYRTLAGLADGKQAESGWTTPVGKQGRNQKEQGEFEVRASVKHQLDREYHETADTVGVPKMIEPMLAKTYDGWPGPGYAQPKLDGIRCIATVAGLFSRQGQPIIAVPHIHAALAPLFAADPDLILDGELYNHDLREDFGAISSIVRKKNPTVDALQLAEKIMQYHVYDVISMADERFGVRSHRLGQLLAELDCGWILPVTTTAVATAAAADVLYGATVEQGYEGGMYRLDKPYEIGRRSKTLLKRKEFVTQEFKLLALEEGNGNWAGAAKRAVLQNDEGDKGRFGAGIRGSYAAGVQLLADASRINEKSTATVRFFMRSPDGVPRFPVVVDIQFDGRVD